MSWTVRVAPVVLVVWSVLPLVLLAGEPVAEQDSPAEIVWETDYGRAMELAKQREAMLLVFFHDSSDSEQSERFEAETLGDPIVRGMLRDYVCVRLPLDAKTTVRDEEVTLLEHKAFEEMLGRPGVSIIDLADAEAETYGYVVSTFPLSAKLWYGAEQMRVILDLPRGTLTQRTMIYAVRTHPDKPASANGQIDANLVEEAESHSQYQARIRLQGHHRWTTRFNRINRLLPQGLTAREVCAESWPGERLVEAAIECVRCWRFSSGHWSAVCAAQPLYGYDIKRGRNGIWYATGIFGGR